jgi:predicted  nucleic acid-binding Zn-ribbon protein
MTEGAKSGGVTGWMCNRCRASVEVQTVRLQYLKTIFALNLPACPNCGMILIDEELAKKMAEAEQALEDK